MDKYKIAHYKKSNSMWFTNGGTLIITEDEYRIKYLFQTVLLFERDKTIANRISDNMIYKGLSLMDENNGIELYFFSGTAKKIYTLLGI